MGGNSDSDVRIGNSTGSIFPLYSGKENCPMKKVRLFLVLVVVCFIYGQGHGLAQTMYVTDRLLLSLRNTPDPDQPAVALLPSDTRLDVLETQGQWAKVMLEDGRTGWVMKRYLVEDVPKPQTIEKLKGQLENRDVALERIKEESASLKREVENLKDQITEQKKRIEITTKEDTLKRLKEIFGTGLVALFGGVFIGLAVGYFFKRSKKARY
jgi:SH3 domain protein